MRFLTRGALAVLLALGGGGGPGSAVALMAGAATVPLDLPRGTPLAGYGAFPRRALIPGLLFAGGPAFWFTPATGVRDGLRVRAVVLEDRGERLLWLALEVVGIDPALVSSLGERLARRGEPRPRTIVLSASHTHSGPGGFAQSELFGLIAMDRPSHEVRERLLDAMEDAAVRAEAGKEPALMGTGSVTVRGQNPSRIGAAVDEELAVVKLVGAGGRPIAVLWNFAIHGTALGKRNLELSGDLMGDASARIEASLGAPALFVNGAVADASPAARGPEGVAALGATLANAVVGAWPGIRAGPAGRLDIARRRVDLPRPRLSLRSCLGPWVPAGLAVGLDAALPGDIEMLAVAVGSRLAAVTIPGELQMALGIETKISAWRRFSTVVVAGLSNGYIGYLMGARDQARSDYMGCATLYGDGVGHVVQRAAAALLREVGAGKEATGRASRPSAGPGAAAVSGTAVARPARAPRPSSRASSRGPTSSAPRCCGG
ncbi:MAG TPA: neutral/alkaline non-lysosomal ceramidase N-terminal domain-containing protein [Candidatus Binatia bacterium]|nr:neutral/alkaline non-lysosomal ceramidase N-terminal domain-containing protein [Candidatus Binatia bacterium]